MVSLHKIFAALHHWISGSNNWPTIVMAKRQIIMWKGQDSASFKEIKEPGSLTNWIKSTGQAYCECVKSRAMQACMPRPR